MDDRQHSILDRVAPWIAAVVTLVVASACAPLTMGGAVSADPMMAQVRRIDILAVSTRRPSENPWERYGGERGHAVAFDRVTVTATRAEPRIAGAACGSVAITGVEPVARQGVSMSRLAPASRRRHLLIFVHGFDTTWGEAVTRLARVVCDGEVDAVPVVFTWPSRGSVFDYLYDRESAMWSRRALEDLVTREECPSH